MNRKISNESLVAFLFVDRALRCVWCITIWIITNPPIPGKPLKAHRPLIPAYSFTQKWWRGTIEAEGPRCAFFLLVRSASRCIRRGGRFLCYRGFVLFRSRASSGTQTNHIWRSFWYFGLIFQRRLFPRKWKRVRREFGNVCFLFGSNDYGIPRFFAESLTTDSCKCHARCLLRCDTKVAGQRKIKGRDDIGLGNFDWAKVSRPWGEERRAVVFMFPLPWLSNHTITEKCYSSMLQVLFLPRVGTRFC